MRIFLSWSGERSRAIAEGLRDWLPLVLQTLRPWMSAHDIDAGARWSERVGTELQQSFFGILCVTPENIHAPWLLFEAGALSKTLDTANVCPILLGLRPADLIGPLAQFHAVESDRAGVLKMTETINRLTGDARLGEQQFVDTFDLWWPKLQPRLQAASALATAAETKQDARRPVEDMVAELLALAREQRAEPPKRYIEIDVDGDDAIGTVASGLDSVTHFKDGQRIEHPQFGEGVVVTASVVEDGDQKVVARFPKVGIKTLRAKYANLRLIEASPK